MEDLSVSLAQANALDVEALATSIQRIGFSCTQCGACCRGEPSDEHTATIYPDEIRALETSEREWKDIARPIPYGLEDGQGETFEWAIQTDACGDCRFLQEGSDGGSHCGVYEQRPAICRTYPFQVDLTGTRVPEASVVDHDGDLLAYECEGLGTAISRSEARKLAEELKTRTIRDLEEAIALVEQYEPVPGTEGAIVHDSEGAKSPDGRPIGHVSRSERTQGRQY